MGMMQVIKQITDPIKSRINNMIARTIIESVNNSDGLQFVKVNALKNEPLDNLENFEFSGFTSTPIPGTEALAIFVAGNREHGIIIGTRNRKSRPTDIPPGGSAIFSSDDSGLKTIIKVLPDGTIELGKGILEKIIKGESFRTFFNAHVHTESGTITSKPNTPMATTLLSSKVKAET